MSRPVGDQSEPRRRVCCYASTIARTRCGRFVHDFRAPFDNNVPECDLRMVQVQHGISGCWRRSDRAERFLSIWLYLLTARKQSKRPTGVLCKLVGGTFPTAPVDVLPAHGEDEHRELTATCRRNRREYDHRAYRHRRDRQRFERLGAHLRRHAVPTGVMRSDEAPTHWYGEVTRSADENRRVNDEAAVAYAAWKPLSLRRW